LIETGPASTLSSLFSGLESLNLGVESLSKLLVTHIHLDHAGASGTLIERHPHLRLYVHEIGAKHLIDPTALLKSATRIYGSQMDRLWGEVVPVPEDNIHLLEEGDAVMVGKRRLDVLYTPGHASHHVVFHDTEYGVVFVGDVAAIRMPGYDYILPPTPPPDIDLELWSQSLERVRGLHPKTIYLAHFGPFSDVEAHLTRTRDQLHAWGDVVRGALERGQEREEIRQTLQQHAIREITETTGDENAVGRYATAGPFGMSADGYIRYFQKKTA
jgi:glyoxylase-like metal-dependent hydrolase (beta-lactamase superfamily II)